MGMIFESHKNHQNILTFAPANIIHNILSCSGFQSRNHTKSMRRVVGEQSRERHRF